MERAWTSDTDAPEFWNPKLRAPDCYNAPAAQTYLPLVLMKTDLVLAGKSKTQMVTAITSALESKRLPSIAPGAMSYMMSKEQYLNDEAKNWHPHVMFFVPGATPTSWGANLVGSPIYEAPFPQLRLTIFMIPVKHWSDGTADTPTTSPHQM